MPQIDQAGSIYFSQLVWLLLIFAIIYFVIGRGMVSRIDATVQSRESRIADDLATAERARGEAATAERDYGAEMDAAKHAAGEVVQAAKHNAVRDAEHRLAAAQTDLAASLAKAELALAEARSGALADIEGIAADAVREIVTRVSGLTVSEGDAMAAVRPYMAA
jgi:F-type H+-transporting ATPase subunit b